MKIKAVGFDIDGTLYPNYEMFLMSSPSFLSHPRLVLHFGKIRKEIRKTEFSGDFRETQSRLLAYSMKISKEKAADLIERHLYQKWVYSFKGVRPFKTVRPALLSLQRDGIRLGALSDFPVEKKLDFLGLSDLMEIAFSSEETGYLKPHKAPFINLISRFGLNPDEILYVGNSYKYDILGAKKVGLRTAHLIKKPDPDSQADFSFYSFLELRDWIKSINN
ncbi:MAG: HAD family hydrolase [Spirochaetes bacterium]|nr:MAG: HAD family hydrolase [Spirochaetota bacterium]